MRDRDIAAATGRAAGFGAPSFIAADELFFGQERLEDAVAWSAERSPGTTV